MKSKLVIIVQGQANNRKLIRMPATLAEEQEKPAPICHSHKTSERLASPCLSVLNSVQNQKL